MHISIEDIHVLMNRKNGPCASVFMPTHQAGPDIQQDPIRLKNLLKDTEQQLTEKGIRSTDIRTWLEPVTRLLEDEYFWRHQNRGLAIFVANEWHKIFRLPLTFTELVMVESQFYLKPILPLFMYGGNFYLLALSQNKVRFFEGSRDGLNEIRLEGIPHDLAESSPSASGEQSLQFHTRAPSTGDHRAAIFHGQGGGDDEAKTRITHFFQQIDKGITSYLKDTHTPLFLTGVEYLFPIYRETNTYPQLMGKGVKGNADEKSPHELHQQVWPIVKMEFDHTVEQAKDRCEELLGTAKASNDMKTVVLAASQGKIDTLFVAQEIQQWGRIDIEHNRVEPERSKTPESQEILDFTAGQTLHKKGTVYALPQKEMPGNTSLVAIFRY